MITNENSVLTTLSVKFWSGYKYDKSASEKTLQDNLMEKGSGNFNKKLMPKFALKTIKDTVNECKYFFNENTLPYNALLGTRILPTNGYMDFQKQVTAFQVRLTKAIREFVDEYDENKRVAQQMLGKLYNEKDYPHITDIAGRFRIDVDYIPVPESSRFSAEISNTQVLKLNEQMEEMSIAAKYDLVERTEQVATSLLHTLKNDSKRIYYSTVIGNVNKLSEQLHNLNYDNDQVLIDIKTCVDDNIKGIRIDYLKESPTYREKKTRHCQNVLQLLEDLHDQN
jgi:hypothetical protein